VVYPETVEVLVGVLVLVGVTKGVLVLVLDLVGDKVILGVLSGVPVLVLVGVLVLVLVLDGEIFNVLEGVGLFNPPQTLPLAQLEALLGPGLLLSNISLNVGIPATLIFMLKC